MKKWLVIGLMLAGLFFAASPVSALGGTPASVTCTILIDPEPSSTIDPNDVRIATDRFGNVYIKYSVTFGTDVSSIVHSYDNECGLRWTNTALVTECGDAGQAQSCRITGLTFDHYGHALIISVARTTGPATGIPDRYIAALSAYTGIEIDRSANITAAMGATLGGTGSYFQSNNISWVGSFSTGGVSTQLNSWTAPDFTDVWNNIAFSAHRAVFYPTQATPSLVACNGQSPTASCFKINVATGAITTTTTAGNSAQRAPDSAPEAYSGALALQIDGPTNDLVYSRWNITSFTRVVSGQQFTPNTISGNPANAYDFDVDGIGNALICGLYTFGGNIFGFVGHFKQSNNTQYWNNTLSLGTLQDTEAQGCQFDYNGGHWVGGSFVDTGNIPNIFLRHYSGGEFTNPTAPSLVDDLSLGDQPPISNTANPIGFIVDYWETQWGFDGSILFGIACVGMVTVGFARIGKNPVPLLIGIGGLLGVILATVLGFFEEWVLFLVAFIIIAIAGNRLFSGNGDED